MIRIYIASPFFNEDQLKHVRAIENNIDGHSVNFFSPRSAGKLSAMTPEQEKINRKVIYDDNVAEMDNCTHMIANISKYGPSRDSGTLFEVGYFAAQRKPIILFCDNIENVSVMLAESSKAVITCPTKIYDAMYGGYCEKHLIGRTN